MRRVAVAFVVLLLVAGWSSIDVGGMHEGPSQAYQPMPQPEGPGPAADEADLLGGKVDWIVRNELIPPPPGSPPGTQPALGQLVLLPEVLSYMSLPNGAGAR